MSEYPFLDRYIIANRNFNTIIKNKAQNINWKELNKIGYFYKDNILYIGTAQNTIFEIDLSTLGWKMHNSKQRINSIMFKNGYAYIAAGYDGMIITPDNNLSNIIAQYDTPDFAWAINIKDNIAYIADSYSGIVMVDINDPTNPIYLDTLQLSGDTQDLDFLTSQNILLASSTFGGISAIDTYMKTNATLVDDNTLKITFPNYTMLGDYTIK